MEFTSFKHIVFVPSTSWGHLRPGLKTCLRMAEKFPGAFITILVYPTLVPKATNYIGAQPTYSSRVKIVAASSSEVPPPVGSASLIEMLAYLERSFESWISSEIQQPSIIQVEGRPVDPPGLIIEDIFNGGVSLGCQNVHKLPVVAWGLMTAASLMILAGHHEPTGKDGIFEKLASLRTHGEEELFHKAGEMYLQASISLLQEVSDRLVCIPSLPVHHEWELNPQHHPFISPFLVHIVPRVKNMLNQVDTIICGTTFEMEPTSAASLSTAFSTPITPFFIGPAVDLISPHQPDPESPVTQFLDRAYTERGAHSVIYAAFGTVFFPLPESIPRLMAALDEIPKAGLRFIFALSSDHAEIDKSWMDGHIKAGNAIFPEWTNQTAVLEHPAIHYFLSHGGWNSSTEALGDQPTNSMQIAGIHDCGIELLQVRTGPAKSTAYQNGAEVEVVGTDDAVRKEMRHVLEMSQGLRGQHQRMNIAALGRVIANSLATGGSGDVGLKKFGATLELLELQRGSCAQSQAS